MRLPLPGSQILLPGAGRPGPDLLHVLSALQAFELWCNGLVQSRRLSFTFWNIVQSVIPRFRQTCNPGAKSLALGLNYLKNEVASPEQGWTSHGLTHAGLRVGIVRLAR